MRQSRPSLSTMPYPVGPAAAGSTPSTRSQLLFSRIVPVRIVLSPAQVYGLPAIPARGLYALALRMRTRHQQKRPARRTGLANRDKQSVQLAPTAAWISDSSISKLA